MANVDHIPCCRTHSSPSNLGQRMSALEKPPRGAAENGNKRKMATRRPTANLGFSPLSDMCKNQDFREFSLTLAPQGLTLLERYVR